MITWVHTSDGNLRMATIEETPGDISIADTPTSIEYIRRVEPFHAERVLGVCMTVTGQMKTEHAYLLTQIQ